VRGDASQEEKVLVPLVTLCVAAVFYIHAHPQHLGAQLPAWQEAHLFRLPTDFLSNHLLRVAVPLLFAISGRRFFRGLQWSGFREKLQRRVSTLLVPYVLWCGFWWLVFVLLGRSPALAEAFLLNPIPFPLWFVRNLILFALLSPGILWLKERFGAWSVVIPITLWMFEEPVASGLLWGLSFFWVGALSADTPLPTGRSRALFVAWVLLCFCGTLFPTALLLRIEICFGVVAFLLPPPLPTLPLSRSFFLFCAHEPLGDFILRKLYPLAPDAFSGLLIFTLQPVALVLFLSAIAISFERVAPRFFSLLAGGRGSAPRGS